MTLPKLFACMMVRNEEANLGRCLDSIRSLCDKIIVVDTGSTDRTIEILRKYGAIVYPGAFNWRKPPIFDFSIHRNEGLQYCEELGADWAFVIDADEELRPMEDPPDKFKRKLTILPKNVHGLMTQVHEPKGNGFCLSFWGTRFFRMGTGVFYDGICHNRPHLYKGGFVGGTDIVLYHYGYSNPETMKKKRARTLILLKKRIREDPDDYLAYYYTCMTLLGSGETQAGIDAGEMCLKILGPKINDDPRELNFLGSLYYAIGWGYFHLWESSKNQFYGDRAYQWWIKGWEQWPDDIDLNFELSFIGYLGYNHKMVKEHGGRYLKAMDRYRIETNLPLEGFVNGLDLSKLAIGARHIHHATPEHEAMVKAMLEKSAKEAA